MSKIIQIECQLLKINENKTSNSKQIDDEAKPRASHKKNSKDNEKRQNICFSLVQQQQLQMYKSKLEQHAQKNLQKDELKIMILQQKFQQIQKENQNLQNIFESEIKSYKQLTKQLNKSINTNKTFKYSILKQQQLVHKANKNLQKQGKTIFCSNFCTYCKKNVKNCLNISCYHLDDYCYNCQTRKIDKKRCYYCLSEICIITKINLNIDIEILLQKEKLNINKLMKIKRKVATNADYMSFMQDQIQTAQIRLVGQTTMQQIIEETINMVIRLEQQGHFKMYNFQKFKLIADQNIQGHAQDLYYIFEIIMGGRTWLFLSETTDIIEDANILNIPKLMIKDLDHNSIQQLTHHLQSILRERSFFSEINEVFEFFEISLLNFTMLSNFTFHGQFFARLRSKRKQANYCGGLANGNLIYKSRWFLITSYGIGYIKEKDFFDRQMREFCLYRNFMEMSYIDINHFTILFEQRKFQMKFKYEQEMLLFLNAFIASYNFNQLKDRHRFNSFSQIHQNNQTVFYINGFTQPNYFNDLCDAINNARSSILITDWWLSPELYLKRPIEQHPHTQLYRVLGNAARRGVKVFVLIYKESPFALPNDSDHAQKVLMNESENIIVIRHPDKFIFFWSHHEKMTAIDNRVLFMGGLDLCFGRYEEPMYPLGEQKIGQTIWYGQDFNNPRIKDFEKVKEYSKTLINKNSQPRMPWRDQAIQVQGPVVQELTKHFRQYWSYANLQSDYRQGISKDLLSAERNLLSQQFKRIGNMLNLKTDDHEELKRRKWEIKQNQKSIQDQIEAQARMRKRLYDDRDTIYLQPVFPLDLLWVNIPMHIRRGRGFNIDDQYYKSLNKKNKKLLKKYYEEKEEYQRYVDFDRAFNPQQHYFQQQFQQNPQHQYTIDKIHSYSNSQQNRPLRIQALRSASDWSIGLHKDRIEDSIYQAYLDLIDKSERFIYIENQFFVSSTSDKNVLNMLVDMIAKRVIRAIHQRQPFLVFIFIPLLPGFAGDITARDGDILRIQMELCLRTIYAGEKSLAKQIMQYDRDWQKYVKIFGLRNHELMSNGPVTEIVYIHSKLMIVDDRQMIVGSANINDRSQLGYRDSELALVIEDDFLSDNLGTLCGMPFRRSHQIMQHRMNCMQSLFQLGLDYSDIFDFNFIQSIEKQAIINDEFFWNVFKAYPHNNYKTLEDVKKIYENLVVDRQYYMDNKYKVNGFVVPWPYAFLIDQPNFVNEFYSVGNTITPTKIFA